MPGSVIFDPEVTPIGNQIVIDPNQNTIKIDPNNNTVKLDTGQSPTPVTLKANSRVAGQAVATPVRSNQVITGTASLDPGYYEVEWMCGLGGRAVSVQSYMMSNMSLKIDGKSYPGVYTNSDKEMGIVRQPKFKIDVSSSNTGVSVIAVQDDNSSGQYYIASICVTKIA